jgi:hypothetical protein
VNIGLEIHNEKDALRGQVVDEAEIQEAMAQFDQIWQALATHEQSRIFHHLIKRINYDGGKQKASITFHDLGLATLADALTERQREVG